MKKLFKKYLPLWIILGSLLVATMMISAKPRAKANIQKFIPPVVETQTVISQEYQVTIESQGTVVPRTEIQLMSEVSGKIQRVSSKLQTGAKFDKGDPLIYLEKRDFELSLISAESSLSQARVNYEREKAESEFNILSSNYNVDNSLTIRVYADKKPNKDFKKALPQLDDVYFIALKDDIN